MRLGERAGFGDEEFESAPEVAADFEADFDPRADTHVGQDQEEDWSEDDDEDDEDEPVRGSRRLAPSGRGNSTPGPGHARRRRVSRPAGQSKSASLLDGVRTWAFGAPRAGGVRWSTGPAHISRALQVAMVGALLCGPIALAVEWAAPPSPVLSQPSETATSSSVPAETAAVGEWAESFVVAWLTTPAQGQQELRYYLDDISSLTLPSTAQTVSNPAVAFIEPASTATGTEKQNSTGTDTAAPTASPTDAAADSAGNGAAQPQATTTVTHIWTVTIGVDVQEPGADQTTVAVRRYFSVPISYTPRDGEQPPALRAITQPAPVSAPTAGTAPKLAYGEGVPLDGALGESVQAFLNAYLTDRGDLSRLLSPRAGGINPVRPIAYTAVNLRALTSTQRIGTRDPTDGEQASVLANANLTGLDGQERSAQFTFTFSARDGRWEVVQVQPAPMQPGQDQDSTSSTPSTSAISASSLPPGSEPDAATDDSADTGRESAPTNASAGNSTNDQ